VSEGLTPKQEAFAQAYVETGNASEAYRKAYDASGMKPATIHVKACELLSSGKVAVRVGELQKAGQAKHEMNLERLTNMTLQAFEVAVINAEPQGMVAAVKQLSKMHGFDTEKRGNERDPLAEVPSDVRRALVAALDAANRAAGGSGEGTAVH
jgi:phage terminase small subunit